MFSVVNKIKNIFSQSSELSKIETAIFNAVREKLQPADAELWDRQLAVINKIHRSPDGKEINLFSMNNGKSDFPKDLCFSATGEFKIAVVDIEANGGAKLRGRVWCVNGHVFSIEYKTSFKEFEKNEMGEWKIHCHIEKQPGA